ncbi:Rab3 GTPase-activating protein catalytic subunit [Striga asiatica]|uniref:Rab3 GTPase-activating protein catalytic subunit n=1 Tax=Striga asiatica TaxID=4170 RepID=A0A5A7PD28_STRAF|nr:Rab3 GTPase-activating protein catalytic subunit [Striga asiatica]
MHNDISFILTEPLYRDTDTKTITFRLNNLNSRVPKIPNPYSEKIIYGLEVETTGESNRSHTPNQTCFGTQNKLSIETKQAPQIPRRGIIQRPDFTAEGRGRARGDGDREKADPAYTSWKDGGDRRICFGIISGDSGPIRLVPRNAISSSGFDFPPFILDANESSDSPLLRRVTCPITRLPPTPSSFRRTSVAPPWVTFFVPPFTAVAVDLFLSGRGDAFLWATL